MNGSPRALDRRSLISGMVAACALCVVWLLPSAYGDGGDASSTPSVMPLDQPLESGTR
ncbi:hypothetical protein [Streptomyces profundus]|uniref:hypothetical protein n=1 Tax=Streptomyces profundus TaxID=2867410 RepID=UPI001D160941|nr:hypothetical protein [Streptomyces sp. MA3_2.13]UED84460.1 hypothetical protein K4G22_09790 [Streptomyces sp. MA3_2.13]